MGFRSEENKNAGAIGSSFRIAFQMYSRIPMPKADWEAAKMRYVMCFFPLVGVCIGAAVFVVEKLCSWLNLPGLLTAAILVLLPVLLSGGIHLDGYMDVCDARGSWGEREKKLEIMKDPHVGSFAVVGLAVLFLLQLGAWYQIPQGCLQVLALGFILSRALSGYLVVKEKPAREDGLNAMFSAAAQKKRTKGILLVYAVICIVFMILANPVAGIAAGVAAVLCVFYTQHMANRQFGGWTGDVAGFFLQLCELIMSLAAVIVWHIAAVII